MNFAGDRFRRAIARALGLHFDDSKHESLLETLHARSHALALSIDQYLGMLETRQIPRREIGALARQLTVSETYFFRNLEQFNALREHVLPARARAAAPGRPLRILSAACATGEEAYSIAIVVHELRNELARPVEITGVDINPAVIEKARDARYSRWSLRGVSEERSAPWFAEQNGHLQLDERIRRMVTFEERNLLDDGDAWLGEETYDVIFCRNLIMYFTPEAMMQAVDRLARALVPGGFLFLGHAETLRGLTRDFHLHHTHETFYYERKRAKDVASTNPVASVIGPLLMAEVECAGSWVEAIGRASERVRSLVDATPATAATPADPDRPPPDLSAIIELLRKELYNDALSIVDALPDSASRNRDVLTLRAVLLAHRGELSAAEEVCRVLLTVDELNAGAHYLMALCREGAIDRTAAVEHDQAAIYLDPGFAAPRLHLGLLERKRGRRFEAGNHLTRALVLLEREDPSRLLFFGGGFSRDALIAFCRAELAACGGAT